MQQFPKMTCKHKASKVVRSARPISCRYAMRTGYMKSYTSGRGRLVRVKMEGSPCCCFSVVVFVLVFFTYGQLFHQSKAVNSKILPVVINTWGPPFTNATAEGMTSEFLSALLTLTHVNVSFVQFSKHLLRHWLV